MIRDPGLLISLEGIDNAGKTTLAKRVARRLIAEGNSALVSRELSTAIGKTLKRMYLGTRWSSTTLKVLLFAADRVERQERMVLPALREGSVVIADRWVHSAIAYRLAEVSQEEREELLAYIHSVNRSCISPSLSIYIDIDVATSFSRGAPGYSQDHLYEVRRQYQSLVENQQLMRIDGEQPIDCVIDGAMGLIRSLLVESRGLRD